MQAEPSRHKLENISQDERSDACNVPLEYLRKITNDFSNERLLGEGGFGRVYKGVLQNGYMIAVKKLTMSMPGVHDLQFENEAHHLMRLKHPNIVQLVGYCSETENIPVQHNGRYVYAEKSERLLCLEYLPNGSLRDHLSGESSGLDWNTRYRIIEGVCRGLHYLHEEWQVDTPIIHMDLKPANILLDDNMVPKIADFGLSRLFGEEKTRTCTQNCNGTLGYMAPEYINRGIITKKLDIFSLGVIILEIITGHKDYPDEGERLSQQFIELVTKNWRNRLEKPPRYTSVEIECEQIRRCVQIGLVCVKPDRKQRPTTRQIMERLYSVFSNAGEHSSKEGFYNLTLSLWPSSSQDTRDGGGSVGTSSNSPHEAFMLEMDDIVAHSVSGGMGDAVKTVITKTIVDGFVWLKCGQKDINSKYPRDYYRCSYHWERGCPATKLVQKQHGDPPQYAVTYVDEHSCDKAAWELEALSAGATNSDLSRLAQHQGGLDCCDLALEHQEMVSALVHVMAVDVELAVDMELFFQCP